MAMSVVYRSVWRFNAVLALLVGWADFVNGQCTTNVSENDRIDCHPEFGATEARCRCRGCHWCVATTPGTPHCFHESKKDLLAHVSLRSSCPSCGNCKERVDCHPDPGATPATCIARGCLWCPDAANSEPWCIYGGLYNIERYRGFCKSCSACTPINCLPDNSNPAERQCKAKGCQWCPSLSTKCSYGGDTPAPIQYRNNCKSCQSCVMKYDCHPEPDATQAKCESRGCLWCISQTPGEPWCLYGGSTAAVCTTCGNCNTKIDCHPEPYADEWSCEDRGCMWCPTAEPRIPFCFYPTVF